ncbi:endonuclease VIII [Cohnella sp. CFH 77786]|uniref:Fpg/Nei family DNA glycosylase n=1 Tax=Cohnella sp. CFH 77786 TaxID=2662265 RepID=UPI001C60F870|nr:DNA-formamidopyrimidine glycosylase family protein [Cohnella sp. CFH 77786]MBW5448175.1 endonuclease VIII [Cohnella sp. CFH 77786]
MPEWPEMETYRKLLNERLCGQIITRVAVNRAKSVNEPEDTFRAALTGRRILFVERKGKQLILHLDDGNRLLLHLMLGGWLAYGAEGPKEDGEFQVILGFAGGENLYFGGLRLGYLHRLSAKQVLEQLKELGPDPFDPRLTPETFYGRLSARRGKLKPALTDQKLVSGIGNCYSDEICFESGIHPETPVPSLDREASDRLFASMRRVLEEAAEYGGYMDRPLTPDDKLTGGFDPRCRVYDREGEPCVRCGTKVVKGEISGRKAFYCPHCQRSG